VKPSEPTLERELLKLLASQAHYAPLPVHGSMGLIAFLASKYLPPAIWGSWMIAVVIMQAVRWLVFRVLPVESSTNVTRRLQLAVTINFINTCIHALSLVCFVFFSPYERALQSMLIMGMGAPSIFITAGYLPFTAAHVCCALLPMYSLWAWFALVDGVAPVELLIALLGVGYMLSLFVIGGRIFHLFEDAFTTRQKLQSAGNEEMLAPQA
jgi:hypothetical protein